MIRLISETANEFAAIAKGVLHVICRYLPIVVLAATLISGVVRGRTDLPADTSSIARLIRELGADQYVDREAANKALEAVGEPAWAALTEAAAKNADPEIRQRATR